MKGALSILSCTWLCIICWGGTHEKLSAEDANYAERKAHYHIFREAMPPMLRNVDRVKRFNITEDCLHEVTFLIRQRNMAMLTRMFHDVSDPTSMSYGQHRSRAEVVEMTSNPISRDIVIDYLHTNGVTLISHTPCSEYVTATAALSLWAKLLNNEFFIFHIENRPGHVIEVVRSDSYFIPRELDDHVESVFNVIELPHRIVRSSDFNEEDNGDFSGSIFSRHQESNSLISPLYDVNLTSNIENKSPMKAVFADSTYNQSLGDLAVSPEGTSGETAGVMLGTLSDEASLREEILISKYWQTSTDFLSWEAFLLKIAKSVNLPSVINIGQGTPMRSITTAVLNAFNIQAIKLGVMGTTLLVPCGDDCALGDLASSQGVSSQRYPPMFPAVNPYITVVGATTVTAKVIIILH